MSALGSTRGSVARRERHDAPQDRSIFGVPARFMVPRIMVVVATISLVAFGLLMIYSASSISAMSDESLNYDAAYYVKRQLIYAVLGVIAAGVIALTSYRFWARTVLPVLWIVSVGMLILIFTPIAGQDAYGATRWIAIGGYVLQPSEFAKITVILTAANICTQYFEEQSISLYAFITSLFFGVGLPLVLIVSQPDKGSTIICAATLLVMLYLAGLPKSYVLSLIIFGIAFVAFLSMRDAYSRARVMTMLNPWRDPYGDGYQLIQGFYAFGSGGLFGVGIGMSRQKYSYLPMAHNDFIFAVIGEELGLVGTLGLLAVFAVLGWAGFKISRYASDFMGRLIAAGCTSMLIIQLLINVGGVVGVFPLSGKPIPFVSYGGTSVISSLMLVGFIISVSRHSALPVTEFERERAQWGLVDDGGGYDDRSMVGDPTPRSARQAGDPGFSVVRGGSSTRRSSRSSSAALGGSATSPDSIRASREFEERTGGRVTKSAGGRTRIDLGPSGADRLRGKRK